MLCGDKHYNFHVVLYDYEIWPLKLREHRWRVSENRELRIFGHTRG